jgi:alkyl hydroperoxide reductase subunit AhpC
MSMQCSAASVVITFSPFKDFTKTQASAIRSAAERYSEFVGKRALIEN